MEQPAPDRRSAPRYAVDAEATVVLVNHGQSLCGRVVELSLEGCRLRAETCSALATPASIEVIFKLHGMGFRLGGIMQWADARKIAGIQFSPMAPRRLDILMGLLAELETEKAIKGNGARTALAIAETEGKIRGAAGRVTQETASLPAAECKSGNAVTQLASADSAPSPPVKPLEPPMPAPSPLVHSRRERRGQARHAVDSRATIFFVDVRAQISGRVLDVSLSGCRIRTDERFPVGIYRRVETEFNYDGLPFRLGGVVQSLHDKFTVGIRFLDMTARKREQLAELMEQIERGRDYGNS